jgi:hypothetical protein
LRRLAETAPLVVWIDDVEYAGPLDALIDLIRHLILPVFTLVVVSIAADSRFVRASMIEALNQEMNASDIKWTCENFWTKLDHITEEDKAFNFTKTAGNEWNTHLCVQGIIKLSRIIPEHLIEVCDEGEYLHCPLLIKNGQAKPNMISLCNHLADWLTELEKGEASSYKDIAPTSFIKSLKRYQHIVSLVGQDSDKKWYPVALFCRPVKKKDFDNHEKYGALSIMAGFAGEYWGLNDQDPQQESLKMLAMITKVLKKAGFNQDQIKIAQPIEKNRQNTK